MVSSQSVVIVFARWPELGRVKTRLAAHFTAEQTLALYTAMLGDTLDTVRSLPGDSLDRAIYWADAALPAVPEDLAGGFRCALQEGRDLGERMYRALEAELRDGARKVLLVGCDSPNLPRAYLVEALDALDAVDLVLGPSADGGYYALGARRAAPEIFEGIEWGTSTVLTVTLGRTRLCGLSWKLLPSWYDVDRAEDLGRLARDPGAARVKDVLRQIGGTNA